LMRRGMEVLLFVALGAALWLWQQEIETCEALALAGEGG
jgi:hypothetical protein